MNKQNNEKLINCVQNYKYLYDVNDEDYTNAAKKEFAWKEIASEINVTSKDCKRFWLLLSDAFRRVVKRQKDIENGHAAIPAKRWCYEDKMKFLIPYLGNENINIESNIFKDDPELFEYSTLKDQEISTAPSISAEVRTSHHKNVRKKLLKEMREDRKDVDKFFAGMAATVKKFPPKERAIAKAKVFHAISKIELHLLCDEHSISSTPPSTPYNNSERTRTNSTTSYCNQNSKRSRHNSKTSHKSSKRARKNSTTPDYGSSSADSS